MPRTLPLFTLVALLCCMHTTARGQKAPRVGAARERQIAARFAPVFRQALGDHPRADYVTNFDFDGDWRGDNNWENTDDLKFHLRAYVYFAASETVTHFYAYYALFHPRDYKGGSTAGPLLSDAIREGVRRGGRYDPTGLSSEAVLAHENDMEGCLVVAEKEGEDPARAHVILVETLAHDRFLKYAPAGASAPASFTRLQLEGQSPLLFVEAKGHGLLAYDGGDKQEPRRGTLVYTYAGRAEDPEAVAKEKETVSYELVPLYDTIWRRALAGSRETFGEVADYGSLSFVAGAKRPAKRTKRLGRLGAAFLGTYGAPNAARPPWGWFDRSERGRPRGEWFFNPAATARRHLGRGADFSITYVSAPYLGIYRP
ncbi:MAG: hypothetical protein ACJ754_28765 [Pyrinomonadaceae bacterium]